MQTLRNYQDTIAAIATPLGEGGISVIRICGNQSISILDSFFQGKKKISTAKTHTLHYGKFYSDQNELLDTVIISIFRKPHSYTGNDVVEISCHGGHYVAQKILNTLLSKNIRMADAGEFTLRAFINNKLDLVQAEAVADVVHAKNESAYRSSIDQLNGKLSVFVNSIRQQIIEICSIFELQLDFSQEGLELQNKNESIEKINSLVKTLEQVIATFTSGKLIKEGIKVAIIGKPNAGKSSLLNILLNEQRAIVSHISGTTRDTIEENLIIDGVLFRITDTAGLRNTPDEIEQQGIERAESAIRNSDVVILLIDASHKQDQSDFELSFRIKNLISNQTHLIYLFNKCDIANVRDPNIEANFSKNVFFISCKTKEGIEEFKKQLIQVALPNYDSLSSGMLINNLRHKNLLEKASIPLNNAIISLQSNISEDFIACDLREALDYLGEIIGIMTPEDILNNIFSNFCIGK